MILIRNDLTGQKFGRLTIVCFSHKNKTGHNHWYCLCECGKDTLVSQSSLKSGGTRSCGCLNMDVMTKHGMSYTLEYKCWVSLKNRCFNKNNQAYKGYGGRGITVCDRWKNSFENFYADMGEKPLPKKDYSIHRIDNDGDYFKENCKWATRDEQNSNKRLKVKYRGVTKVGDDKFKATIIKDSKFEYLGTYFTELDAATAYDNKSQELTSIRPNGTKANYNLIRATLRQNKSRGNLPRGVCKEGKKFSATISAKGNRCYLGTFDTELEAAKAYDDKCEEFGDGRPNNTERGK